MIIKNKKAGVNLDIVVLVILTLLICITTIYMAFQTDIQRGVSFGGVENLYQIEMNVSSANFYLQMLCDEALIITYQDFMNNKTVLLSEDKDWFINKFNFNLESTANRYSFVIGPTFSDVKFDGQDLEFISSGWETKLVDNPVLNATFIGNISCKNSLINFGLNSTFDMKKIYLVCNSSENKVGCFKSQLPSYSFVGNLFTSKKQFFYDLSMKPISFIWA